ncbi:MAG: hypothetical protein IIW17_03605 [Clostridia bacterium]|nr:hypothetical protein [Clostridia bacterium]
MKLWQRIAASVMISVLFAAIFPLSASADGISLEQEAEYELVEELHFASSGVYSSLTCHNVEKSRESSASAGLSWCTLRFGDQDAYVYSTRYLQNTYEDCSYVVIRYSSNAPVRMTWTGTFTGETYSVELPTQTETVTLMIQMQRHMGWNGKIETLGFAAVQGESAIRLHWLKVYAKDPHALYSDGMVVLIPEYSYPLQTYPVPETETDPPIEVDTDWETLGTEQLTDDHTDAREPEPESEPESALENTRSGLFFEVFGDDALAGCQGASLGCKGGGCNAVTGGLFVICLFAAGIVFRKHD